MDMADFVDPRIAAQQEIERQRQLFADIDSVPLVLVGEK
jgi:hypothetical protein